MVTTPANGSSTNDTTPTYTGTAEENSTVTVIVDGASIGTTTADAAGNVYTTSQLQGTTNFGGGGLTSAAGAPGGSFLSPGRLPTIPGVGPATTERLHRAGVHTVAELERLDQDELIRIVGNAFGTSLFQLARAEDDRPVVADREAKSISVEGTYDNDLNDRKLMEGLLTRQAKDVGTRMRKNGFSGRTVSIKVRLHDFTTLSRSTTLASPTDATAATTVSPGSSDASFSSPARATG